MTIVIVLLLCQYVNAKNDTDDNYNKAVQIYRVLYDLPDAGIDKALKGADSLINVGTSKNDYRYLCLGHALKARMFMRKNKIDKAISEAVTWKNIALNNTDYEEYFHAYLCHCEYQQITNSAKAMVLGQKMIAKAQQLKYMPGLAWGHEVQGNLNLYSLQDYPTASSHFKDAIAITKKVGENSGPDIVRLYLEYASSLEEEQKFKESTDILNMLETKYRDLCSDDQKLSILFVRLDNAYYTGVSAEKYDELYQKIIHDPCYEMLIDDDIRLYYRVRWLIRTHRELQALKEIPRLALAEDRYLLKAQSYESLGDWKNASMMKDSIEMAKDSIMHGLRAEELIELDAEMKNSELAIEAADNKTKMQNTIFISISCIITLALLVTIYILYRRRKNMRVLRMKNEELRIAKESAEKANSAKTIFIQNMSHEFHTPLNHIYGFAQVMANKDFSFDEASYREMSQHIVEGSEHLTKILDDFVAFVDDLSTLDKLSDKESVLKK